MTEIQYNVCVDAYADHLFRFVLKSLRDDDAAKDVVQDSFLRLWENRESVYDGKEKSYLFTIAYRLIVDHVRLRDRKGGSDDRLTRMESHGGGEYDNLSEILSEAIDALPDLQRSLVLLRDYDGYSYQEIGEITGLSEPQVKVYIFRARTALKQKLGALENII
ncbi:MAG: RNA polymerase sigma factor [Rikenellaceae bacterium]|jgi:RNA polymerase sigma-70 factor (ECF subfamily)|nr:RNA polymerase sigma factor [Rikenellaceae bacterium]